MTRRRMCFGRKAGIKPVLFYILALARPRAGLIRKKRKDNEKKQKIWRDTEKQENEKNR